MTVWLFLDFLRLVVALAALGMILTTRTRSHSLKYWMTALAATEFGHWFAIAPLLVIATSSLHPFSLISTVLAAVAVVGFLAPAFQAWRMSSRLPGQLQEAFTKPAEPLRFSWARLLFYARTPMVEFQTVIYDETNGLRMNFYHSSSSHPSPCVLVLHTGGWGGGAPEEFQAFNSHIAHEGYAVAAIQYRLAPQSTWPAPREDVRMALDYLRTNCVELGIDSTRFVLLGRSAGGQIAEAFAYLENDPAIRGCIAFYAPSDMNFSYRLGKEDDILKSPMLLRNYFGGTPSEKREAYREASPRLNVHPGVPPTLLLHGIRDSLVWYRQSERLEKVLRREGIPHCYIALPWATHAFDYNYHGPGGQLSKYAVDYFLKLVAPV